MSEKTSELLFGVDIGTGSTNIDHFAAFARYEGQLRDYARGCQKLAEGAGPFLAPATLGKIRHRNRAYRMLSFRPLAGVFNRMTTKAANAVTPKDYQPRRPAENRVVLYRVTSTGQGAWWRTR